MDKDLKLQIDSLAAETMALQAIIVGLCNGIQSTQPALAPAVEAAFDYAADIAERIAITHGKNASADHTVATLKMVEQLRAAVLGSHSQPRHGV
jgi:hypothetical protein